MKSAGLGQANRQSECSHSATCPALPGLEGTPNRIKTSSKPVAEEIGRHGNSAQRERYQQHAAEGSLIRIC